MSPEMEQILTDDEKDILQEVMNIAFGSASADLAELIDIYVVLNVPEIHIVQTEHLLQYLVKMGGSSLRDTSIVNQKFWGDFSGSGLLVFSEGGSDKLVNVFGDEPNDGDTSIENLEHGVLTEMGNILLGACVGKVSELLKTIVTYSPPNVVIHDEGAYESLMNSFDENQVALAMKTVFEFKERNVDGFLLIVTNDESVQWLRRAINEFAESFC